MSILTLENIHYSVHPHFWSSTQHILKGVNLRVEEGSIFGFLGPNGAGKTTTIKAILGLITPQKGSINILGGSIEDRAIRSEIGFTPEHPIFPDHLTCRELVQQHALLAGLTYKEARKEASEVIGRVNLTHAADRKIRDYSKGMLQRTGLAQALVGKPKLLLLDEPMGGVDPIGRREIREIMMSLREQGSTVLFSTHILPDIEMICDSVGFLINGEVRRYGPPDQLIQKTSHSTEIIINTPAEPISNEDFSFNVTQHALGSFTRFTVQDLQHTDSAIDILRAKGSKISKVIPLRPSLEDLFLSELNTPPDSTETTNA